MAELPLILAVDEDAEALERITGELSGTPATTRSSAACRPRRHYLVERSFTTAARRSRSSSPRAERAR